MLLHDNLRTCPYEMPRNTMFRQCWDPRFFSVMLYRDPSKEAPVQLILVSPTIPIT